MADRICRRKTRFLNKAARAALEGHGQVVSMRQLTRVYGRNRREIETRAMLKLAVWNVRYSFSTGDHQLVRRHDPERWLFFVNFVERALKERPELQQIKDEIQAAIPVYRWLPDELVAFVEKSGLDFPDFEPE